MPFPHLLFTYLCFCPLFGPRCSWPCVFSPPSVGTPASHYPLTVCVYILCLSYLSLPVCCVFPLVASFQHLICESLSVFDHCLLSTIAFCLLPWDLFALDCDYLCVDSDCVKLSLNWSALVWVCVCASHKWMSEVTSEDVDLGDPHREVSSFVVLSRMWAGEQFL